MKTLLPPGSATPLFTAACVLLLFKAAGPARSQGPGEAWDPPGLSWMPEGEVTLFTGPRPGFDLAAPVRLSLDTPPPSRAFALAEVGAGRPDTLTLTLRRAQGGGYGPTSPAEKLWRSRQRERLARRDRGLETVSVRFAPGVAILTARREDGAGPGLLDRFTITPEGADSVWGPGAPGAPGFRFTITPPEWACHYEGQDGEGWNTVWMWGVGSVSLHVPGGMMVSRGEKSYRSYFSGPGPHYPLPDLPPHVSGEGGETVTWRRDFSGVPSRHWITISPSTPGVEAPDARDLTSETMADAAALAASGSGKPLPVTEDGNAVALSHAPWDSALPEARFPEPAGPAELRFSRWEGYPRGLGEDAMREHFLTPGSSWKNTETVAIPAGVTTWTLRRGDWAEDLSSLPAPR